MTAGKTAAARMSKNRKADMSARRSKSMSNRMSNKPEQFDDHSGN
jgi:hypothetical protein